MSAAPLISVTGLSVAYTKDRDGSRLVALEDVDLEVRRGEFIAIVGPSGCGKTTLINVIAGLVSPERGTVAVGGAPVTAPGPDRAMVFQDYALMPWRSVADNVRFGLEFGPGGRDKTAMRERVARSIDLVGLTGFEDALPHELSGGMRQRVGIARALVSDPAILLADEPFGAVDAMTREAMQAELERIIDETGQTVLLITHSIDEALILADRIVVISNRPGRVREIVDVDLPRPRSGYDVKTDPRFVAQREHLWEQLKDEALGAKERV